MDPARGCSSPDTLSSSSMRRRGPEPTAERPPAPPGTPAAEPAEGPLRTAAAIFTRALGVAWRGAMTQTHRDARLWEGKPGVVVLRLGGTEIGLRALGGREHARGGRCAGRGC